ncbi:aldo/keto reductase family oxidoreductase [Bacillus spongiae]|uniref:Aldo/keto reductase family oxidoreductase n=1 Tax=Bacillus spongiae TaxID=2683610 RepID=A0ABU8HB69_9BACI
MERIKIAENLSFSRIVHGLWRLSDWDYSTKETLELIEYCLEQGITTFDHADIYGDYTCERRFGEALALKPELRSKMEIVTKCGIVLPSKNRPLHNSHHYNVTKEHIIHSVETSLSNLHTDYVDVLLIHRPSPMMDPAQIAEAFSLLKQQGKVRHFGVSNFKSHQYRMLESYLDEPLITNQIELSAYELENIEDGTLSFCQEKRIAPMAWSPLAGGKVFNSEGEKGERLRRTLNKIKEEVGADGIDQVLYSWLLQHPTKIMPIIGTGKKERIQSAIDSLSISLNHDQWFEILHSSMGHEVP